MQALPADLRSALTATPRVLLFPGRIDLLPPSGRRTEVRLRPLARPGGLAFAVIGIERAGVSAPVNTASAPLLCVRTLGSLPFGASVASVAASTGMLDVRLRATGASFSALG